MQIIIKEYFQKAYYNIYLLKVIIYKFYYTKLLQLVILLKLIICLKLKFQNIVLFFDLLICLQIKSSAKSTFNIKIIAKKQLKF